MSDKIKKIEKDIKLTLQSINHWIHDNYFENDINFGYSNCPLCKEYHVSYVRDLIISTSCINCPIYQKTGKQFCKETPHDEFPSGDFIDSFLNSGAFKEVSIDMILFLSELLKDLKEKLDNEIESFGIGDYVQLKDEIEIQNVKYGWPDARYKPEDRKYIFKVTKVFDNDDITVSYYSGGNGYTEYNKCHFDKTQFNRINPILKNGSIGIISKDCDTKRIEIIEINFNNDILSNFCIVKNLKSLKFEIVNKNDIQIIFE